MTSEEARQEQTGACHHEASQTQKDKYYLFSQQELKAKDLVNFMGRAGLEAGHEGGKGSQQIVVLFRTAFKDFGCSQQHELNISNGSIPTALLAVHSTHALKYYPVSYNYVQSSYVN